MKKQRERLKELGLEGGEKASYEMQWEVLKDIPIEHIILLDKQNRFV